MLRTQLRYLELILEHGTFVAAARQAGVSQPAVSKAITELQRRFLKDADGRVDPNGRTWRELNGL